jgi:hypothetical protein
MKIAQQPARSKKANANSFSLERKLGSYLASSASIGAVMASDAKAVIVSNPVTQNVGINGFANIDFNSDGQTDFQIDHDRVDLGGGNIVDYLQLDKNDVNGASPGENLFASDFTIPFPVNGTVANDTAESSYLVLNPATSDSTVRYPEALLAGNQIGPSSPFDFQEGDDVFSSGKTGRLNRLIDEDHGQADMALNGKTAAQIVTPANSPQFLGVVNQVRYLGVKMDLNNGNTNATPVGFNYGWIGIKITNEADATGQVVGYGYETQRGVGILAGDTGARAGDYNNDGVVDARDYVVWRKGGPLENETATPGIVDAQDYTAWRLNYGGTTTSGFGLGPGSAVPEPGSALLAAISGLGLIFAYICRRIRGK